MNSLTWKHYLTIIILILFMIMTGLATYQLVKKSHFGVNETTKDIFLGKKEAPGVYQDIDGNNLSLESYLGKILVVSSWASWSPFSAADLVKLDEYAKTAPDEVVFLAINRMEPKEQAARYLNTLPPLSNLVLVLDTEDRFYRLVDGYAMPETVIFNEKGDIVLHDRGVLDISRVIEAIDTLVSSD